MIINFDNKQVELIPDDNSYSYEKVRGSDELTLHFNHEGHLDIPVGAWVEFEGRKYQLMRASNLKKNNTRNFEYTLIMHTDPEKLKQYKFRDVPTGRLIFDFTGTPKEFAQLLVDNLNMRDTGWKVGTCVDAVPKTLSFNHTWCWDAAEQTADAFNTEFEFTEKTVHFRKVEYDLNNPLPLSYGRGNGFKSGLGRSNADNHTPVEVLFAQGGDRNINYSEYGSKVLLLPKNQTIGFDGSDFYYTAAQVPAGREARWYKTDASGYSLQRSDRALRTKAEDSVDCQHIYPSRVGTISSVVVVNADKNHYDFIDKSIPSELDFTKYLIPGETMTVILQDKMLAGREFDVKYVHSERKFQVSPQEYDGRMMPDATFALEPGQTYAVFGMMLPDSYICNNSDHSGASWDMYREAVRYMYENEEERFSFTGELDGIWAKKDWLNIGGRIRKGGYVLFTDDQFQQEGIKVRIVGVKRPVNNPKSPTIELSNVIVRGGVASELNKIEENEVVVENKHREALRYARRRWRDSVESLGMLEEALLDNFENSIMPITVQTMAMLVGDESLQFRFVNSRTNPQDAVHTVTYNNGTKILTAPSGIIQHMTLGIDTISSAHKASEYKFWTMTAFTSPALEDEKKYYLYARVSRTGTTGTFYLSETSIGMEDNAAYYYLLIGILNSAYEGERTDFVPLYGYTEVLPGRITTKKVVSVDGQNYLDFENNAFRIGNNTNYLEFNVDGKGELKTVQVVSNGAKIGNWIIQNGQIVSNTGTNNKITLDATNSRITASSSRTGGSESSSSTASTLSMDAVSGYIEARNSGGTSYISANGIFSNNANTNAVSAVTGITRKAAVVGLGYGNVSNYIWDNENFIAGVYGTASNSGSAPAYGGFFQNLYAAGLILHRVGIDEDAANPYYLTATTSMVIGYSRNQQKVYLPSDGILGKTIFFKQWWSGSMRVYARSGQSLWDDSTKNDYFDIGEGQGAIFTFTIGYINDGKGNYTKTEAWLFNRYKW